MDSSNSSVVSANVVQNTLILDFKIIKMEPQLFPFPEHLIIKATCF